jgi:hypothetical protein
MITSKVHHDSKETGGGETGQRGGETGTSPCISLLNPYCWRGGGKLARQGGGNWPKGGGNWHVAVYFPSKNIFLEGGGETGNVGGGETGSSQ